jgi:hypothetical protein
MTLLADLPMRNRRRHFLHPRGGIVIEFEMKRTQHHPVHPIGRDHVEQLHDLLVAQMTLKFGKGRILDILRPISSSVAAMTARSSAV